MSSWLSFLKMKEILPSEISKFTKICKFQKNLFTYWRLLNDYGLIISIKITKKLCGRMLYLKNWRRYKYANLLSHFDACTEMGK